MNGTSTVIFHYAGVIAGEVLAALVLAIILFAMLTYREHRKSSNYLFLAIALEFLFLLGDAASFYNLCIRPLPIWFTSITYFASYTFGILVLIPFSLYSKAFIEEKAAVRKWTYVIPVLIAVVDFIITVAAIISGSVYGVVEGKMAETGGAPAIISLFQLAAILYLPIVAFSKRKQIGLKAVMLLGLFGIMPFILIFVNYDYTGIGSAMALLIVYVLLQCDTSAEKEKQRQALTTLNEQLTDANEEKLAQIEEITALNSQLEENQTQLEEAAAEQEAQMEEISALNSELEERQAQLEEVSVEQESQLTEIQELNDRLKDNLEKTNIFAALSYEYAAVHVADLDEETFTTIRRSPGMVRENYETETTPYWETVTAMAERFVLPEIREDFLKFLEPEAMKKRMEQEEMFTYRYAVIPDETGDYVYEMTFVNISEDKNRHHMVLGARCIDKILQFEREEGQYNTALLNECEFYFGFDVTSGIITEDFITRSNYDLLKNLEISFPISYDDFWRIRTQKQSIKAKTEKEAEYWTVEGLRRAFEEGKKTVSLRYESDLLGKVWEATIILTQDMTSRRLHAVYICKDITEMMKADMEIKQALEKAKADAEAANNAKTSFLFNMSHDIRTPMNAIMGFRDLLEKHQEEPERRADYLKKIEESSNVLLSIINNVLEMARIEKGTIEIDESAWSAEQFNDTLYSIFHEMMTEKGITFTRQIDVKHPYVYCDPIKLREVFINILSNAYKYTNAGGSVNMHLEEVPSTKDGYAMYRTTITDTGIGMSEEFLPHIFEEFSRENTSTENKIEGTGLGMPIVKRLVDFMDGTIEVTSQKGVGSTFIVTIPHRIAEKSSLVEHAGVEIDPKLFEGKRILLAEDNDLNAEIAVEILSEAGFVVDRAEDGLRCIDMMEKAVPDDYDLILMDIQMPHMNGYDATRAIRQMENTTKANIPILAMTANAFEEDKREALRSGMNGHLAKPIHVTELMKALAGILG